MTAREKAKLFSKIFKEIAVKHNVIIPNYKPFDQWCEKDQNLLIEVFEEMLQNIDAEQIAKSFHEIYERLAPDFNYKTKKASALPWQDIPENNKNLMIAVVKELFELKKPKTEVFNLPDCIFNYCPYSNLCSQDNICRHKAVCE